MWPAAAVLQYEGVDNQPKSKLNRDIGTRDETAAMDLQPIDIEAYEMLDQNHVGFDAIPSAVVDRLKEFNR